MEGDLNWLQVDPLFLTSFFQEIEQVLFQKHLNSENLECQKIVKIIIAYVSFLGTGYCLKHCNRPLISRSKIDFLK